MSLHTFTKFLFDLILVVLWLYVPMFHLGLKDSPNAWIIWFVDVVTLGFVIYLIHRRGIHSLYSK